MQRIWSGLLFCLVCTVLHAGPLQTGIDKLIQRIDPDINIGIDIVDLRTGNVLYQRNAARAFIPASNMKLFSEAAALMVLGPGYRFKNHLSIQAKMIKNGTLHGTVYLHMSGDPSLTQNDVVKMLQVLRQWDIHTIKGQLVIVSANRHINAYAPGWMVEDLKYSYGAPLAPVILDENRLTLIVNPSHQPGKSALVEFKEQTANIIVNNQIKTRKKAKGCAIDYHMGQDNHLTVRGCVGKDQWAIQQGIAIRNPLLYTQEAIRAQLAKLHIQLNGKIVLGTAPKEALLLATHESKPVSQLLADALKPSDNLYADSLYLHAAAKLQGGPVNWEHAKSIMRQFLQKQTGIDLKTAVLTDGSGLSRHDQLTPRQTVQLLQFLHDRFSLAYEFIAALPIAGYDGTLQKRFLKPKQRGFVRAKTGTMTGIVTLSGYLYTANAHTLAFAIFINGMPGTPAAKSGRYRYLVDAVCDYFLKYKPQHKGLSTTPNPQAKLAFQNRPTQAELRQEKHRRWRKMESAVKKALARQPVSVLFRDNELVLLDHGTSTNQVWQTLVKLKQTFPFAVVLKSDALPPKINHGPLLVWHKHKNTQAQRTWVIHEVLTH